MIAMDKKIMNVAERVLQNCPKSVFVVGGDEVKESKYELFEVVCLLQATDFTVSQVLAHQLNIFTFNKCLLQSFRHFLSIFFWLLK